MNTSLRYLVECPDHMLTSIQVNRYRLFIYLFEFKVRSHGSGNFDGHSQGKQALSV